MNAAEILPFTYRVLPEYFHDTTLATQHIYQPKHVNNILHI
jgi:hypothetical protein